MSAEKDQVERFKSLFLSKNPSLEDLLEIRSMVYSYPKVQSELSRTVSALESGDRLGLKEQEAVKRLGAALWMNGQVKDAQEHLSKFGDTASRYITAQCLISQNRPAEATAILQKIPADKRADREEALIARSMRLAGRIEEAMDHIKQALRKHKESADLQHELGMCLYEDGNCEAADEAFSEALRIDPEHRGATFNRAYLLYQHGLDEEAIELYEKCAEMRPAHAGAVANLAMIYEDMGKYDESAQWLQKLHEARPSDEKIKLLSKFAGACTNMYYDEERQKQAARRDKLLAMPIADFELSIRSRKCLEEMEIGSLGDLVGKTESELLSFNNFGETSLTEVKSILKQKGLVLKQEAPSSEGTGQSTSRITENEALNLTLEEAGLSTRVRKCLEGHRINTIKDVCEKSEQALLKVRDFGRASLRELKRRLTYYNLPLKEE